MSSGSACPRWLTVLGRVFVFVVIAYVIGALVLHSLQRSMIFPRRYAQPVPNAGSTVPGLEQWWVDTPQGKVEGWFLPGEGVSNDDPGPAVIFAHGNAELIDYWGSAVTPYRELGISVLLPEYRGYGRSAGDPSQEAITADFVKFYDRLAERPEVDTDRIVFHGRSLGGGALSALATVREPEAMILESTFTSIAAFAKQFFMPKFLVSDPFDTLAVVRNYDGPVLVMHGMKDQVVPFEHGKKLAEAAKKARFVTYEAGHNDFPPDRRTYWEDIANFLESIEVVD